MEEGRKTIQHPLFFANTILLSSICLLHINIFSNPISWISHRKEINVFKKSQKKPNPSRSEKMRIYGLTCLGFGPHMERLYWVCGQEQKLTVSNATKWLNTFRVVLFVEYYISVAIKITKKQIRSEEESFFFFKCRVRVTLLLANQRPDVRIW